MTTFDEMSQGRTKGIGAVLLLLLVLAIEFLIISLTYRHGFEFECRAAAPEILCAALGYGVIRGIAVSGAFVVLMLARGEVLRALGAARRRTLSWPWLGVEILGFALILAPLFFLTDGASLPVLVLAFGLWLGGAVLAGLGLLLSLFAAKDLLKTLTTLGWSTFAVVGVAALAPELAALFQQVWRIEAITFATFRMVETILMLVEPDVVSVPERVELGLTNFIVLVGPQCSGVEGFALITAFLALYIWLFRDRLSFPAVFILFPIGIALSWAFNILRIAVLILIGEHISPDLAVNGFHSHAGWLMFTLLAVGIAWGVHRSTWFRATSAEEIAAGLTGGLAAPAARVPFFADPMVAMILPFIVFMASALLASTFFEVPSVAYPARALAMAAALWLFRGVIRTLDWRLDPIAIGAGAAIGVAWLATAPAAGAGDTALIAALAAMSPVMFAIWVGSRMIGTMLLVPLIEEMFFRGYVQARLDRDGDSDAMMRIVALLVSAGLFALLHDRWLAAALAGVVFGLIYLRKRRLGDAVQAHAVANTVIAVTSLYSGDWSLI